MIGDGDCNQSFLSDSAESVITSRSESNMYCKERLVVSLSSRDLTFGDEITLCNYKYDFVCNEIEFSQAQTVLCGALFDLSHLILMFKF